MNDALRAMTRFGLGASGPDRAAMGSDPRGWIEAQVGRPATNGAPLLPAYEAMRVAEEGARMARETRRAAQDAEAMSAETMASPAMMAEGATADAGTMANGAAMRERGGTRAARPANPLRDAAQLGRERALGAAALTADPFAERWTAHWTNHLTVRGRGAVGLLLVAPYRAEAIEPHAWGRFADLLAASTLHPAMLNDLDNRFSVGPDSHAGKRGRGGTNENLARELMELHTLGADGGYTQADVSALALTLTGWRLPPVHDRDGERWERGGRVQFVARAHEPGPRTLLGRRFAEDDGTGSQTRAVLDHLAAHPSTARNVGRRLAAHFHSPGPGRAGLAGELAATFRETGGDLAALAMALISGVAAWRDRPVITTPQEQVTAWLRMLPGVAEPQWGVRAAQLLGQTVHSTPTPEGWAEAEEWGSPGGLKARLDLANELGLRGGNTHDPIALARDALGVALSDETMTALRRAASPAQGLAILAMSPEVLLR